MATVRRYGRPASRAPVARRAPRGRARAGHHHQADRHQLARAQHLAQHHEAGQRGHRRLQAHQHAEHARRAGAAAPRTPASTGWPRRGSPRRAPPRARPGRAARRRRRPRRTGAAARRPPPSPAPARRRPGCAWPTRALTQDVRGPERAREQRQRHARAVETRRPKVGQQQDAGRGEHHPEQVERAARPEHRHAERAHELERHRHAERDAVERRVERVVHPRQGDSRRAAISSQSLRARSRTPAATAAPASSRPSRMRSSTVPPGPISSNSVLASAPPICTDATAPRATSATGGTRVGH